MDQVTSRVQRHWGSRRAPPPQAQQKDRNHGKERKGPPGAEVRWEGVAGLVSVVPLPWLRLPVQSLGARVWGLSW